MGVKLKINDLQIGYVSGASTKVVYDKLKVNFETGMLIGIIGKNGLGKSTLLRTIAGLQQRLKGEIVIDEVDIDQMPKVGLAKKIGVVLTEKVGGFNLNVLDLVSMGRVPYTNSFNQIDDNDQKIIDECIDVCGLNEYRLTPLAELSDGLFQKTMIAKGLAQQTPILLLDEPTAFLDFPSKHQLFELLKKVCSESNKCIITSSHDIELILKYCSHLFIMSDDSEFEFTQTSLHKSSALFHKVTNGYFN